MDVKSVRELRDVEIEIIARLSRAAAEFVAEACRPAFDSTSAHSARALAAAFRRSRWASAEAPGHVIAHPAKCTR